MNQWDFNEGIKSISEKLTALSVILAAFANEETRGLSVGYTALNYVSDAVIGCRDDLLKLTESNGTNTTNN